MPVVVHPRMIKSLMWDEHTRALQQKAATVEGHLRDEKGLLLYHLARQCSGRGVLVEIGSFKGKSTTWLAQGSQDGAAVPIYAIDPHTGSPELRPDGKELWTFDEFRANIERGGCGELVTPIVKPSLERSKDSPSPSSCCSSTEITRMRPSGWTSRRGHRSLSTAA